MTLDRLAKDEGWPLHKERAPRDVPRDRRMQQEAERAVLELSARRGAIGWAAARRERPKLRKGAQQ